MSVPLSTDSLVYDTLLEVMDQVAALDRKVTRLLSAAGIGDPPPVPAAGHGGTGFAHGGIIAVPDGSDEVPALFAGCEYPPDLARALQRDPTLGGKLHDIHGGPGEDCWCGYVGHDPAETT